MTEYEKYQLAWMIDHGYSLTDFVNELIPYANEISSVEPFANLGYCIKEGFYDLANGGGLNGELWVCEAEWETNEKSINNDNTLTEEFEKTTQRESKKSEKVIASNIGMKQYQQIKNTKTSEMNKNKENNEAQK